MQYILHKLISSLSSFIEKKNMIQGSKGLISLNILPWGKIFYFYSILFALCNFMQVPTERVHIRISIEFPAKRAPSPLPREIQVKYDLSLVSDSGPFI
jgi:hypothetical protein